MKSVIKVYNMNTSEDISNINVAISNNQGVVACQINSVSKEIEIIYDDYFVSLDNLIEAIEVVGYTVI
ncbi:heavy-metal-associated domain-containing protein [Clostridium sp. CF011]|uniref:heavy-metal-associated domain-containing protein n=1 Tax=Clostridium TaxID=1485 RepID=UPI0013EE56B1|nr:MULTISPECIES: heavy-metal-associated domain-containing protein [Clostridium]MBU3093804.1 heavy-metal-associated domain-containing protein [Clostridium sp. CF011]MBW9146401.1 heavy-metal-associated domain-containing protein [Clostridium sp. CM027]MBZ9606246.1 heavy-metal-associated domain-containing protein [Clostridium estertheticum]UVE39911.1 heavy-metal-associated domain-containing protein [Clostridium sp. CM027]WAG68828.1 heavy-metal-associated domain-containing protein [Clostridium sp. 